MGSSRSRRVPASMFCSVSCGSASRALAVEGINCITPMAPLGDSALCFIADSALATLATKAGGRELRTAASRTNVLGSVDFGVGGGTGGNHDGYWSYVLFVLEIT